MTFSIIIPTFNARDKLLGTLDSIRAQNFDDLEIWVQDGNSSDGTREFLKQQRDIGWASEPDAGVYDAMNKGIAATKGRFLYFLGAGDELEPGVLAQVAEVVGTSTSSQALFLYGDVFWTTLERRYDGQFSQWKMTQRSVCHQAIFYDRAIFGRLGLYDLRYPIGADFALNIAVFGDKAIEKRWIDVVISRYEGGGLSSTVRDEVFLEDLPRLINRHFSFSIRVLYRLRRGSPRGLKKLGAPLMRALGWVPDEKMRAQMPGEKP